MSWCLCCGYYVETSLSDLLVVVSFTFTINFSLTHTLWEQSPSLHCSRLMGVCVSVNNGAQILNKTLASVQCFDVVDEKVVRSTQISAVHLLHTRSWAQLLSPQLGNLAEKWHRQCDQRGRWASIQPKSFEMHKMGAALYPCRINSIPPHYTTGLMFVML